MTIEDYCISLNPNNFFLVVLGVVDMCHDLLNVPKFLLNIGTIFLDTYLIAHIKVSSKRDVSLKI